MAQDQDFSRRDFVKTAAVVTAAAAAIEGAPAIQKVKAANDQVQFGMIGTGSRGSYLLKHLEGIDNGRCVALCDINDENLKRGVETIGNNPKQFKDYRELLAQKDVDAVYVTTPLFVHYPVTRDALMAGKHVFCEKCLVFKPDEVHALRALAAQHPKQTLQTGLQRRYSYFYQMVKSMVDKGILGNVHHIHAQWHRNMINKPSSLWTMKPNGEKNIANWRLYRSMSGGLTAELTSHQVDVADWMFGHSPEFVMGFGSLDTLKDGRDVYDNIQLIYRYPNGRQLTYSAISTNQHLPYFNAQRAEMGECIMTTDMEFTGKENFLDKEVKFARRWLTTKGVMIQEEKANPVDTELESFFRNCRDGGRPKADLEVGMADSVAVILSNMAMDEGR